MKPIGNSALKTADSDINPNLKANRIRAVVAMQANWKTRSTRFPFM